MMVSRMREAGETMFSVCSAWVSQLMKSCRELWKSVARVKASSSFTCRHETLSGKETNPVFFFPYKRSPVMTRITLYHAEKQTAWLLQQ